MKVGDINPLTAGLAVLLFLTGATASFLGLGALARPADFSDRVAAAEALQRTIKATPSGQRRFGDTAVCSQATIGASQALRKTLAGLAAQHELSVADLQATPAPPERALLNLAAVDVQLTGSGGQSAVLALIADLEHAAPTVFIDRLELRPKAGRIDITLSGRAFCAISTRR